MKKAPSQLHQPSPVINEEIDIPFAAPNLSVVH